MAISIFFIPGLDLDSGARDGFSGILMALQVIVLLCMMTVVGHSLLKNVYKLCCGKCRGLLLIFFCIASHWFRYILLHYVCPSPCYGLTRLVMLLLFRKQRWKKTQRWSKPASFLKRGILMKESRKLRKMMSKAKQKSTAKMLESILSSLEFTAAGGSNNILT